MSTFVAYSSLPVSNDKVSVSSCGLSSRQPVVYDRKNKHGRSKKVIGADVVGQGTASCDENSNAKNWAVSKPLIKEEAVKDFDCDKIAQDRSCRQSAEAKLYKGEMKNSCRLKFHRKQGRDFDESSHRQEIPWPGTGNVHTPFCSIAKPNCAWALAVFHEAERPEVGEKVQLLEKKSQTHVACGGGLHYKAFLREKFFSTRRKQGTTIYDQELLTHHHGEPDSCSVTSNSSLEHDDDSQEFWSSKNNNMKVSPN
ncbi:hypothetical protein L7F22_035707 [Adiantum nelumboides]|nr:hypothetical protein [Adiantum nelumboides]